MSVRNFNTAFYINSHPEILIAFLLPMVGLRGKQPLIYRLMSLLQRGVEAEHHMPMARLLFYISRHHWVRGSGGKIRWVHPQNSICLLLSLPLRGCWDQPLRTLPSLSTTHVFLVLREHSSESGKVSGHKFSPKTRKKWERAWAHQSSCPSLRKAAAARPSPVEYVPLSAGREEAATGGTEKWQTEAWGEEVSRTLQATAKHSHLKKGSRLRHRWFSFWEFVHHCFPLSLSIGWGTGNTSHGSTVILPFPQRPCGATSGEHPPSCVCPSGHTELSQGDEHLLYVKHLLFLYTFVINITAVTVHFLFHCCLLSVNHHLNPPLFHSCWKGRRKGSGLFGLWFLAGVKPPHLRRSLGSC